MDTKISPIFPFFHLTNVKKFPPARLFVSIHLFRSLKYLLKHQTFYESILLNNILWRVSYKTHTERIRLCSWFCKSCIYIWGGQPWSALMSNCQTHQPLNSMLNSGSKHNGNKEIMISNWQCINIPTSKVGKILEGILDLIPSPSVKIQIYELENLLRSLEAKNC